MPIERQDDDELLKAYKSLKPQQKVAGGDAKENPELLEAEFNKAQESILRLINVKDEPSGTEKALFLYAVEKSLVHLAGYASLNYEHVRKLVDLQTALADYDKSTSGKQADDIRPLNWLITSNPGEGKSHLVSCIAKAPALKDKVSLVSYNMANMRTADDLIHALDEVRNVSVTGKLPMLFLDEIDTKDENFGLLLPLLWDGQIQVGINRIRIGRAVIVAAGSKPYLVRRKDTNRDKDKNPPDKLRDFISRITFETAIPPLAPNRPGGIDQVCIAIAILRHMYNPESVTKEYDRDDPTKKKKTELLSVPVRLLNFIYRTRFYYGVRSITHFLEHLNLDDKEQDIDDKGVLKIERLERALSNPELAAKSGLLAHIREDDRAENEEAQLKGLVADWTESKGFSGNAPIWCKTFTELKRPSDWPEDRAVFYNAQLSREQSGAEWYKFVGAGIDNVGVLYFFPDLGVWQHGKGRLRHIFFNLNTIAAIIRRLENLHADLYSVGHEMGKAFGSDFFVNSLKLETQVRSVDMKYAIEKWCQFDVSGGWGLWGQAVDGVEKVGGIITVENSFFVAEVEDQIRKGQIKKVDIKKGDHAPHCVVMQGYIAGVLEAFSAQLGPSHKFEVEERKCGIEDLSAEQDPKCRCIFGWKERPTKRPSQGKSHRRPARGKAPNIRRG